MKNLEGHFLVINMQIFRNSLRRIIPFSQKLFQLSLMSFVI
jgi:hypothetical protein